MKTAKIRAMIQTAITQYANYDKSVKEDTMLSELARWDDEFVQEHYEATGGDIDEIVSCIASNA